MSSLAMTRAERVAFLAAVRVGVISLADGARGPLAVPIWYGYEPGGELWIVTDLDSRKGRLLRDARRISLCVQSETPPYQYVSVEGPIRTLEPAEIERHHRPLAHRYLGRELGDRYIAQTVGAQGAEGSIVVRMQPERWLTVDYRKAFPG
jgi:nitroimidazol reductase NimA-like FMN-containing flavoprotein (pyridoxamine 5'-phosphate oxidase superfamily)